MTTATWRSLGVVLVLIGIAFVGGSPTPTAAVTAGSSVLPPFAWSVVTADATQGSGLYTAIALDPASRPYISYVNDLDGTFRLASDVNGTWKSEIIAGGSTFDGDTNVVVGPNYTLEVSYYNAGSSAVMYGVRGASGWKLTRVDAGFSEGFDRLALDSAGRPAIAYTAFDGSLRYASWNGTAWSVETVDNKSLISRYEDLVFDPLGRPHIAYYGNGALLYAVRTIGGWARETVDPTEGSGWFSRIRIDSRGWAHIAYYASANRSLMYATEGPDGWTRRAVELGGDSGYDLSFVLDPVDRAQITYYQRSTGSLRFAMDTSAGWVRETVDTEGVTGWYTGIATDSQGLPHISYFDWTDASLRYAVGKVGLQVRSLAARLAGTTSAVLRGELVALGNHSDANVSFQVRPVGSSTWAYRPAGVMTRAGTYSIMLTNLSTNTAYEFQAIASAGSEISIGATLSLQTFTPPPPPPNLLLPIALAGIAGLALTAVVALWRWRRRPKEPQPPPISYAAR